nr:PREDICTED: urocanate hydratase-like [Anolis carolinensis]|eukprot:XP_016854883.1 PREDICTED: urocanate hydratase-like [Anolis carolinensis]
MVRVFSQCKWIDDLNSKGIPFCVFSLRKQVAAINKLSDQGLFFWDYGNAFLLEAQRAGADVGGDNKGEFRYPSYVQHIMGYVEENEMWNATFPPLDFGPFSCFA